ncbi:MAG: hypothetical protein LLF98_02120 [Clostridium sp.]|jgi:predicted RNA-binding Zn-ribbon protein involved in translation (DUF1610 family)|uniref:hypothetical protein n=1 Tax=Clostridium sp. TaxID=1506 RepID=UPI0025B9BA4A|nr:hypothetical protein [Clostridium sp.]MCE5220078.1 hypothetical protein [Clostridium sp.]
MGKTKFTYEIVYNEFKEYGCILLSKEYINCDTLLNYICRCGNITQKTFARFHSGRYNCPECKKRNKTYLQWKKFNYYKKLVEKDGSILLSESYIDSKTSLKIQCSCGNIIEIGTRSKYFKCNDCTMKMVGINKIKSNNQFLLDVYNSVGDEYRVLSEYISAIEYVKMKHNTCGYIFKVTPNNFLSKNSGCPNCKKSKGEKRISNYLILKDIIFISQYKFNNCRDKNKLPFDFAIFDKDNNLLMLIEYDGELHYKPYNYKNKEDALEKLRITQHHDKLKNDYCKNNNIKLLRIPYWEFNNIETILEKEVFNFDISRMVS